MFYVISYNTTNSIQNPALRSWLEERSAIEIQDSVWLCDLRATDSCKRCGSTT